MEKNWERTTTDIEAYDWRGKPMCLKNVPAIKNTETGRVLVEAADVARAEYEMLADTCGLEGRDIALLLLLYAKPGLFKEGEVYCKYHLNKMLFYEWKNLEKHYLGEAVPHDDFRPAPKGPIPVHLWDDLKRLEGKGIITLEKSKWGKTNAEASIATKLTKTGLKFADDLWKEVFPELREVTLATKEQIFQLDPETVMKKVHREYPEYKKSYTEADTE